MDRCLEPLLIDCLLFLSSLNTVVDQARDLECSLATAAPLDPVSLDNPCLLQQLCTELHLVVYKFSFEVSMSLLEDRNHSECLLDKLEEVLDKSLVFLR